MDNRIWICSQLGAREKYAIPRALHMQGKLGLLYTDMWVKPGALLHLINGRAAGRYHADLAEANVHSFTTSMLKDKVMSQVLRKSPEQDLYYDRLVAMQLMKMKEDHAVFFGYSYSSLHSLKEAKSKGYKTVLGQINPGPAEAQIVIEEHKKYANGRFAPHVPDEAYWDRWREEVELSDIVMANSEWSKMLLIESGVRAEKIVVVPLAYEGSGKNFERTYKSRFDVRNPLELLYLGGIGIRKGFHVLIDAMRQLVNEPVHLHVVGGLKGPRELLDNLPGNTTWHGAVPANAVGRFYEMSDVFVFPTLSDGFGLTQLEAQSYCLPVMASRHCAPVIRDGKNGVILKHVSEQTIVHSIREFLANPELVKIYSQNSELLPDYSLDQLAHNLQVAI